MSKEFTFNEADARVLLEPLFYHAHDHQGGSGSPLFVYFRTVKPGGGPGPGLYTYNLQEGLAFCREFNGVYDVYVGPGLRKEAGSGKKDNVHGSPFVWVDRDNDQLMYIEASEKAKHAPSFAVCSGNGQHFYWTLDKYSRDLLQLERTNQELSRRLAGDNCHDVSRVMRVPGTINMKNRRISFVETYRSTTMLDLNYFRGVGAPSVPPKTSGGTIELTLSYGEVNLHRLSGETKALIMIGHEADEERKYYRRGVKTIGPDGHNKVLVDCYALIPDRNLLDMRVVGDMVAAGYSDDEIVAVFLNPSYKISEKTYEKLKQRGENEALRYLGNTIGKARGLR